MRTKGQEIITGAESAFADHRAAGIIREARATIVLATQAYTSILGSLDKRYADVLMLNLSNELIFTCANHDSAVIASKNIGEREVIEKLVGLVRGEEVHQLPARHQAPFPAIQVAEAAQVHGCDSPLREAIPQAARFPRSVPLAPTRDGSPTGIRRMRRSNGSETNFRTLANQ